MRIGNYQIFKEKAGMISLGPCWVCFYPGYLHAHDTLLGLLWQVVTEYKHDKHLVGI